MAADNAGRDAARSAITAHEAAAVGALYAANEAPLAEADYKGSVRSGLFPPGGGTRSAGREGGP